MIDVSGFGLRVNLVASITFPQGIELTQFADDADPADMPSTQIKDKAMGLNGDLIAWAKANALVANMALIGGSDDDNNMQILLKANRAAKGRRPVQDVITMTLTYPSGEQLRLTQGALTDGIVGNPVASAGRFKSKPYIFAFEDAQ